MLPSVPNTITSSLPGAHDVTIGDDMRTPFGPKGWIHPDHDAPPLPVQRCQSLLSPPRTKTSTRCGDHETADGSPVTPTGGASRFTQPLKPPPFELVQ